jgi:hypothetical protein
MLIAEEFGYSMIDRQILKSTIVSIEIAIISAVILKPADSFLKIKHHSHSSYGEEKDHR